MCCEYNTYVVYNAGKLIGGAVHFAWGDGRRKRAVPKQ